jgi:hypothetical protein
MTKFKKGELVMRKDQDYYEPNSADVFVIKEVLAGGCLVALEMEDTGANITLPFDHAMKLNNFVYDNGMKVGTSVRIIDSFFDPDDGELITPPPGIHKVATPEIMTSVSLRPEWIWVQVSEPCLAGYTYVPANTVERIERAKQTRRMPLGPTASNIAGMISPVAYPDDMALLSQCARLNLQFVELNPTIRNKLY